MENKKYPFQKTEAEWLELLGEDQYKILRGKNTERAYTGAYNLHTEKGGYNCGACKIPLFTSDQKFDSGCGWPSFDEAIQDRIEHILDKSHGMLRTEIVCANCGSHLGHVFNDGPTDTGQRFCVNSLSLGFEQP